MQIFLFFLLFSIYFKSIVFLSSFFTAGVSFPAAEDSYCDAACVTTQQTGDTQTTDKQAADRDITDKQAAGKETPAVKKEDRNTIDYF